MPALESISIQLTGTMSQLIRAPQFPADSTWLNSKHPNLTLADLRGQVVLLDFWTYCCINCIHVLPDLQYLEAKYKDAPFAVIGVHSAKFENEQDLNNIISAIDRYQISHPILVDNNHGVWDEYAVRAWPTFVLIDAEGYIQKQYSGEGLREMLASDIQSLLEEAKANKTLSARPLELFQESTVTHTLLSFPGKIVFDDTGKRLFISDSNHNRILVCELSDYKHVSIQQIIGSGIAGNIDGAFEEAQLKHPQGVCYRDEKLYICDTENHTIRAADLITKQLTTLAGTGSQAAGTEDEDIGPLQTSLNSPWDIDYIDGHLYIAMAGSHQIWSYNMEYNQIEVFAGNRRENIVDGYRFYAQLAQPSGLSINNGTMYFADSEVSALRKIDLKTEEVKTLIGTGLFNFGHEDGSFERGRLQHPLGVCAEGNTIYIADTYNHAIREADLEKKELSTVIGKKKESNVCMIGDASCQLLPLFEPNDVVKMDRFLYIADTNNHLIRVYDLEKKLLEEVTIS